MTVYCMYAVLKLKYRPSEFYNLDDFDLALMVAFIDEQIKAEKSLPRR